MTRGVCVDHGPYSGHFCPRCRRAERAAVLEGERRIAEVERERDEARAVVEAARVGRHSLEMLRHHEGNERATLAWARTVVRECGGILAALGRLDARGAEETTACELETGPECNRLAAGRPNGPGCGCRPGVCTLEPAAVVRCSECGRDLHGYRGPRCRYCDGTAE